MQAFKVVVALLFIGAVSGQFLANLTAQFADGFDTVMVNDLSFISELSVNTWDSVTHNITFYAYGDGAIRTVFPGEPFVVGSTPYEQSPFTFIDYHTFQDVDGTLWGFGPIDPWSGRNHNIQELVTGLEYKVGVFSTKPANGQFWPFFDAAPIDFLTIFSAVDVIPIPGAPIAYFAGFFAPNSSEPQNINFGVYRTYVNMGTLRNGVPFNGTAPFTWTPSLDIVTLAPFAQLAPYNRDFKPILVNLWNVPNAPSTNSTYLVVIDPVYGSVNVVQGSFDPTVALTVNPVPYLPRFLGFFRIVSAVSWRNFVFIGLAASGNFTGRIDVIDVTGATLNHTAIEFPPNLGFSNPKALVIDHREMALYVGFNGGPSVMRIDISGTANKSFTITGMQQLPFYLHRVWVGADAHNHVYFATNEQHAKVFRVAKTDFCDINCPFFGYCSNGKCACSQGFEWKDNDCKYKEIVQLIETEKRNKGGEIALGVFFTLSFLAAVAGWYLVWKNKRSAYQAV